MSTPSGVTARGDRIAAAIEHTLLRPEATPADIERLCDEALACGCHGVCVAPSYIALARERLGGSPVAVVSVIGFPLGATLTPAKAAEAELAIAAGASELDMVLHVGRLRSGDLDYVQRDIEAVVERAGGAARVKVILETALLTRDEKLAACAAARAAGADFVKTSTGLGPGGATEEDVRLLDGAVGGALGIKAAGGIRDLAFARRLLAAGASRLGTSATLRIVAEEREEETTGAAVAAWQP